MSHFHSQELQKLQKNIGFDGLLGPNSTALFIRYKSLKELHNLLYLRFLIYKIEKNNVYLTGLLESIEQVSNCKALCAWHIAST